jgi:hypothetical protein
MNHYVRNWIYLIAALVMFGVCAWNFALAVWRYTQYEEVWGRLDSEPTPTFVLYGPLRSWYSEYTVSYSFSVRGTTYSGTGRTDREPRDGGTWVYYKRSNPTINTPIAPSDNLLLGGVFLLLAILLGLPLPKSWPSNNALDRSQDA